jgi:Type II CAAX prenyl endopeptidase Rce1-like
LYDFLIVAAFGVLGLLAHVARKRKWLEWILRVFIFTLFLIEAFSYGNRGPDLVFNLWASNVLLYMSVATLLTLFLPFRKLLSLLLSAVDLFVSGQLFVWMRKKTQQFGEFFESKRVFIPTSVPHMIGLFIYISTLFNLLSSTEPGNFEFPALPMPIPLPLAQLFSYNGFGLVLLSFCGIGIFISRNPREAIARLGWEKPTRVQIGVGLGLVAFSFAYDAAWAFFTHGLTGQELGSKLSSYNAGTFAAGGLAPSMVLALATALCAGIGEETLVRGALQPVFGIFPAAFLHGMLHGQFAHAPIFILQVAIWSTVIGIVRRYTNTTTTIIGHAGFNFLTTFLFAFNPPDF